MTKSITPETRAQIVGALATIGDIKKIAQLYQVTTGTVARIQLAKQKTPTPILGRTPPREAENTMRADADYAEQIKTASLRLRDAVRMCRDGIAMRAGRLPDDWVAFDEAEMRRNKVWRMGRSL